MGKGLGAGGLEKQDAFPLTRAIFTQGLRQPCSVPPAPGWESPWKTSSLPQQHPGPAKQSETRAPEKACVRTAKRKHQRPQHCRVDPAGDEVAAGNGGDRSGRCGAWTEACWGSRCQEDPASSAAKCLQLLLPGDLSRQLGKQGSWCRTPHKAGQGC